MTWHLFFLVWGEPFVGQVARVTVPFLMMGGNIPALSADDRVVLHIYTDPESRQALLKAVSPLSPWCSIDVRIFDDTAARAFHGPDFKYELQRWCLRDLVGSLTEGSMVLLDSNFLLSDGTLSALAVRRREGYRAVCVPVLRATTEPLCGLLAPALMNGASVEARSLIEAALNSLHHITKSFFVDATPFSPYPSQMSWRVEGGGFVTRNFLPHPLMVPVSSAFLRSQSTMDYDLTLRLADDDEIYAVTDSDEMLVVKISSEDHQAQRVDGRFAPTVENLGLFLLTCTNRRHRLFADAAAAFHSAPRDQRFDAVIAASQMMIDDAYAWIDMLASRPGQLDARLLMYLKSHLGPIEDFMSPQLEPSALGLLR